MHIRARFFGKPETIVTVESRITKIEKLRLSLQEKFGVPPENQRLFYGGKLLEDGYTLHDYSIKLNDVIQVMERIPLKTHDVNKDTTKEKDKEKYVDADSAYYAVDDLVDARDRELGAWFEGKIVQIVHDPNAPKMNLLKSFSMELSAETNKEKFGTSETKSLSPELSAESNEEKSSTSETIKDINDEDIDKIDFTDLVNLFKQPCLLKSSSSSSSEDSNEYIEFLLYKVQWEGQDESEAVYFKLDEIRPRARRTLEIKDLKKDQMLMVNYNVDEPSDKGYWYDFLFKEMEESPDLMLVGTVFVGPAGSITQMEVKVPVHDKIFAIEKHTHVSNRPFEDYRAPEKRSLPLECRACRDVADVPCKKCGCAVCYSKQTPENILLCDECNTAYHIGCLSPPLEKVPEDDWYCPSCKRDTSTVIAPGASRQKRKTPANVTKDWGRGMACVGKTKSCAMPSNHFGPIPGVEVGMRWRFRIQVSESGVHRPPVAGIHGRDKEGAYSIVLSGGYEDDVDRGEEFTYTGSGGRDLSGNKRTAEQSSDQLLTRENKALARNCAVKEISEDGADAGENWRDGKPVRVVRSYKMLKHFPKYAPAEGIRYDGIYKVVKYYTEEGLSGFKVWKYLLRRDDPAPAPWEPNAKVFPMLYPDGYLEAEAEKVALKKKGSNTNKSLEQTKTKKRKIVLVTSSEDESDNARPEKFKVKFFPKKRKTKSKTTESESTQIPTSNEDIAKLTEKDTNMQIELEIDIPKLENNTQKMQLEEPIKGIEAELIEHMPLEPPEIIIENNPVVRERELRVHIERMPLEPPEIIIENNAGVREREVRVHIERMPLEPPARVIENNAGVRERELRVHIERMSLNTEIKCTSQNMGNVEVFAKRAENITSQASQIASTKEKDCELSLEQNEITSSEKNKNPESPIKGKQIITEKKKNNTPPPSGSKKELNKTPLNDKALKIINKDKKKKPTLKSPNQLEITHFFQRSPSNKDSGKKESKENVPIDSETVPKCEMSHTNLISSEVNLNDNLLSSCGVPLLSDADLNAIRSDLKNINLWKNCMATLHSGNKKTFVDVVSETFNCIICQELAADPATTPCLHSFCSACLTKTFRITKSRTCPCCRSDLSNYQVEVNTQMRQALRNIMPGYDAGRSSS